MSKHIIARWLFLMVTLCFLAHAQPPSTSKLDLSAIRRDLLLQVGTDGIAGLALAVSKDGVTLWEEGFGWADREAQIRADRAVCADKTLTR